MADIYDNNPAGFKRRFVDTRDGGHAEAVVVSKPLYVLLVDATETGVAVPDIIGGHYIWNCESADWSGAKAELQYLTADGETWALAKDRETDTAIGLDANGSIPVVVAQGACLRVKITGTPDMMQSTLGGY